MRCLGMMFFDPGMPPYFDRLYWEEMSAKKTSFSVGNEVGETNNVILARARALHDRLMGSASQGSASQAGEVRFRVS